MTIAIGFHANDGVILAADMQQTIGDMKTYDGKVHTHLFDRVALAIAGAGYDDYIQTAMDALVDDFPNHASFVELKSELKTAGRAIP